MKVLVCLILFYSGISFAHTQGSLEQTKEVSSENSEAQNCEVERRISAERYESFYEGREEAISE